MADESIPKEELNFVSPQFLESYANNVRFESSVWDLRMLFGTLDQRTTPSTVRQNIAINVPWSQVKIMAYFLQVNLILHEAANGAVSVPLRVRPVPPETVMTAEELQANGRELIDRINALRLQMFGASDGDK